MRSLLSFLFLLSFTALGAQTQVFSTSGGEVGVTPITHATMALEWNGKTVYIDPYGGAGLFSDLPAPDLILITDIHGDHLNKETLADLELEETVLIAPSEVVEQVGDLPFAQAVALANGKSYSWEGMDVEALPMYNLPETDDSRHPKGRGNGYVLNIDGLRLYISGDTEDIPEMRALEDIDVAFVCMNLPYTMTVEQAADAVLEFEPAIVIPFHYRGGGGTFSDVNAFRELVNKGNDEIEVRLLNWYPEN